MNNLQKIKKIKHLKTYTKQIFKDSPGVSIMLVGSIARNEKLNKYSDVDIILYSEDEKFTLKLYKLIHQFRLYIKKEYSRLISLQVITSNDLELIIAPTLISSYINDGILIYGKNIKEKLQKQLSKFSHREKMLASFKRMLFERYYFRESFSKLTFSNSNNLEERSLLSKKVRFFIKELNVMFDVPIEKIMEIIKFNRTIPTLPVLPDDFKDSKKAISINTFIDELVISLKEYLQREGEIKLDVW